MYEITYRSIATLEYLEAIDWYKQRSARAAGNFIRSVDKKLDSISDNPYLFKSIFKKFYEVSISRYPYAIVYFIEEEFQRVVIVAIYHHKRHPREKYRG